MHNHINEIDAREFNGILVEYQIRDIGRIFSVCFSDLGLEDIEIDFKAYTGKKGILWMSPMLTSVVFTFWLVWRFPVLPVPFPAWVIALHISSCSQTHDVHGYGVYPLQIQCQIQNVNLRSEVPIQTPHKIR